MIERCLNAQILAQINNYIINKSDLYLYILFLGTPIKIDRRLEREESSQDTVHDMDSRDY